MSDQNARANVTRWTIRDTIPEGANLAVLEEILGAEAPLIEAQAFRDHEARISSLEEYREAIRQLAAALPEDQALLRENGELRELLRRLSAPG